LRERGRERKKEGKKEREGEEGMEANQNLVLIVFPLVPKLYMSERKIFLSSKMMNPQPQHIQK